MSIKTTHSITREVAMSVISDKLHELTDEHLAEILLGFKESYFRNYAVYDTLPEDDDPCIRSVEEFFNNPW